MEQTEPDFRDIERAHELPPDEPHPRYDDEPEDDELDGEEEELRAAAEAFAYHLREEQRNEPT